MTINGRILEYGNKMKILKGDTDMTLKEELKNINLRKEYLEKEIQKEKEANVSKMIESLRNKYILFEYEGQTSFAYVLDIDGFELEINTFRFTGFELRSEISDYVNTSSRYFDIDSLKILTKDEFDRIAISCFEKYILNKMDK